MSLEKLFTKKIIEKAFLPNKTLQQEFIKEACLSMPKKDFANYILLNCDQDLFRKTVREMYFDKNNLKNRCSFSEYINQMQSIINEWNKNNFGEFKWPCPQKDFDRSVQRITYKKISFNEKLKETEELSKRFILIKMFSTLKHDYIEDLIIKHHENVIPTLRHCRGYDFFIDGKNWDLKVSSTLTKEFKRDHGEDYKKIGKRNPSEVAKYLYQYQDEGRFGHEPRFLIAFSEEMIDFNECENTIKNMDLSKPFEISFGYNHVISGLKNYTTKCYCLVI